MSCYHVIHGEVNDCSAYHLGRKRTPLSDATSWCNFGDKLFYLASSIMQTLDYFYIATDYFVKSVKVGI